MFYTMVFIVFGSLYHLQPLTACKLVSTTVTIITSVCAFLDSYVLISLVTQVFLSVTVDIIGSVRDVHYKKTARRQRG